MKKELSNKCDHLYILPLLVISYILFSQSFLPVYSEYMFIVSLGSEYVGVFQDREIDAVIERRGADTGRDFFSLKAIIYDPSEDVSKHFFE